MRFNNDDLFGAMQDMVSGALSGVGKDFASGFESGSTLKANRLNRLKGKLVKRKNEEGLERLYIFQGDGTTMDLGPYSDELRDRHLQR